MTKTQTLNKIWQDIQYRVYNNVKVFLLKFHVEDILRFFQLKVENLVKKYCQQLPSHVVVSEFDDLRTVSLIELLETFKVWDPEKADDVWPLAYIRITGAMKDHIRHITRTDPTSFYEWVSDAAYMFLSVNNSTEFETSIENSVQLTQAMKVLSERDRKIIIAHTKQDMTFKQIGKNFGISESQVSRVYNKALKALRHELEKNADK